MHRRGLLTGGWLLLFMAQVASGQESSPASAQASAFLGTWKIDMSSPAALVGTNETIRIWNRNGTVAASLQVGKFPANDVTGILKDGNLLVLTTTLRENGRPIWVAVSLKVEGDTMSLAQMMERSETIKRGSGKKLAD
jgi:hypothetical protein